MKLHREGTNIILVTLMGVVALNVLSFAAMSGSHFAPWFVLALSATYLFLTFYFFRIPDRKLAETAPRQLISPADGKVVVIEKVFDKQYFNGERIQISIFMSPLNVHINWFPLESTVVKSQYQPGKYLVAWHPKSSELNECHWVVLNQNGTEILVKQIAGAAARRIVNYAGNSGSFKKGEELGFIKFGSRVDILLPTDAKVNVELGQKVSGLQTIIAELNN